LPIRNRRLLQAADDADDVGGRDAESEDVAFRPSAGNHVVHNHDVEVVFLGHVRGGGESDVRQDGERLF